MTSDSGVTQHAISSITVDGKEYRVALRLAYDGVEYIGRLWFSDPNSDQMGIPDHGAVPGRTIAEAVEVARKLTPQDLERDRKSTRLNSSHLGTSYAVICLKKKTPVASPRRRPF